MIFYIVNWIVILAFIIAEGATLWFMVRERYRHQLLAMVAMLAIIGFSRLINPVA